MRKARTVSGINYNYYKRYRYYYFENIFRTVLIIQCLISQSDGWAEISDISLEKGVDPVHIDKIAKIKIDEIEAL